LSKQAEIPFICGKGQGQHMEKKSGKKQPFLLAIFIEVSVFTVLTVHILKSGEKFVFSVYQSESEPKTHTRLKI
jgi:hypothetical protein